MMNADDIRRYRERNLYRSLRWDDWVEKNTFKLSDANYYEARKAWFKGYNTGEELDMNRNLAEINGGLEGRKLDMNEQSDMVSVNSEDTIEARAHLAWYKWAKENNIDPNTADPETYELMKDAFIDGYLNGFTKRITG